MKLTETHLLITTLVMFLTAAKMIAPSIIKGFKIFSKNKASANTNNKNKATPKSIPPQNNPSKWSVNDWGLFVTDALMSFLSIFAFLFLLLLFIDLPEGSDREFTLMVVMLAVVIIIGKK